MTLPELDRRRDPKRDARVAEEGKGQQRADRRTPGARALAARFQSPKLPLDFGKNICFNASVV